MVSVRFRRRSRASSARSGATCAASRCLPSAKGLPIDPGPPPFGDPSTASYKDAAVAVIRATSRKGTAAVASSPIDWNVRANAGAPSSLQRDVQLYLTLNGALNDAAVAAYGAKRAYQSPRPISMIRYLAFQGQSSDPKAPSYNTEGLPLVPGLIELITKQSSAPGRPQAALAKRRRPGRGAVTGAAGCSARAGRRRCRRRRLRAGCRRGARSAMPLPAF